MLHSPNVRLGLHVPRTTNSDYDKIQSHSDHKTVRDGVQRESSYLLYINSCDQNKLVVTVTNG